MEKLCRQGAQVRDIALYDTVTSVPDEDALAVLGRGYEAISFTSPSSVRGFLEISGGQPLETAVIACIGPVTADAAVENGLAVTLVPDEYTLDGLVQTLSDCFGEKKL